MATKYVVTAPYVTMLADTVDGRRLVGLYRGAPVPDGVPEESIQHHLDSHLIAPLAEAEAQPGEVSSETGSEPASTEPGAGEASAVEAPAGNASLEDWQEFARSKGASDEDLEGKTRNDLRDSYGA